MASSWRWKQATSIRYRGSSLNFKSSIHKLSRHMTHFSWITLQLYDSAGEQCQHSTRHVYSIRTSILFSLSVEHQILHYDLQKCLCLALSLFVHYILCAKSSTGHFWKVAMRFACPWNWYSCPVHLSKRRPRKEFGRLLAHDIFTKILFKQNCDINVEQNCWLFPRNEARIQTRHARFFTHRR